MPQVPVVAPEERYLKRRRTNPPPPTRFDENEIDVACSAVDALSTREKAELLKYLQGPDHVPEPLPNDKPVEPETALRSLFGLWVNVDTMDVNDVTTVAETLYDTLTKVLPSEDMTAAFAFQLLTQVRSKTKVDCSMLIQKILQTPYFEKEMFQAPPHLHPDAIAKLPDHHPDKIKKWRELNKEMVRRLVYLQTENTKKFWLREMSVTCSLNWFVW